MSCGLGTAIVGLCGSGETAGANVIACRLISARIVVCPAIAETRGAHDKRSHWPTGCCAKSAFALFNVNGHEETSLRPDPQQYSEKVSNR
jgi:hypothetical protein